MRRIFLATGGACAVLLVAAMLALQPVTPQAFERVRAGFTPSEAYLLDRNGVLIDTVRVGFGVRRLAWTPLGDVSPALVSAILEAEDKRFWMHSGVDWVGVAGALKEVVTDGRRRGASTLSMQLASLLISARPVPASGRTWSQKVLQVRMAYGLERHWSKQQILEGYLNLVQFRGELQGIGTVAQVLSHKSPAGLTEAEGRVLAALLPAPEASAQRVAERACARLSAANSAVNCDQLRETANRLLTAAGESVDAEHLAPQLAGAALKRPGETVRTTLDASVQREASEALSRQLSGLHVHNVRDGAAVVVDNGSGDVLAYVGSAGSASRARHVDGVRAPRQAGSTLKPFLYEQALERRYVTAASILEDEPVNLETVGGIYLPQDYDHDYKGPVSVRTALGGSLNIPAVRTLMLVGVEAFRNRLQQLGYAGIVQDEQYYGYSLALGSAEVTLWQQAQAYRVLARGGMFSPIRVLAEESIPGTHAVLPAGASFIVGDILSDRAARAVTFGLESSLTTGYWSAVKTGTSKDMRDNWCIGYTPRYTVAVWVGNFEGDPMHDVSGVTGAAPVWREIMDTLQKEGAAPAPKPPDGVHASLVSFATGNEAARPEWFLTGTQMSGSIAKLNANDQTPQIESPTNGMIVAIDPDIPSDRQRLPVRVKGNSEGLVVRLDDAVLGQADKGMFWQPRPGAHRIVLEDSSGSTVDQIRFTVR